MNYLSKVVCFGDILIEVNTVMLDKFIACTPRYGFDWQCFAIDAGDSTVNTVSFVASGLIVAILCMRWLIELPENSGCSVVTADVSLEPCVPLA